MRPVFIRFARTIARRTDGTREERQDLTEELAGHLEETFRQLQEEGHPEVVAESIAMKRFGDGRQIGRQIQEALYPYRRGMILTLAAGSLLFGFAGFYAVLLTSWHALTAWLVLSSFVGSVLLAFALDPPAALNRRLALNSLFIFQIGVLLAGTLLTADMAGSAGGALGVAGWLLILLSLALIYRTTAYDYRTSRSKNEKHEIAINAANVTTGIFSLAVSLFFFWAALAFSDGTDRVWMFAFIPAAFWGFTYLAQAMLLNRGRIKIAYGITGIQVAVIITGLLLFFRIP
ncbi:permease prefix domain 1-containing protein [Bhargavaea ullalensis]|uniref:Uncharacterized protein n=1 Tax=Bhargavaea ullalensis TaxID=1265685 RepID=A0ABV2GDW5_9BACL